MVSLERQGLGARTGLTVLCVPGDGSARQSLRWVEGDGPGLWGWASFGFGAKGGFCMPEERKTRDVHLGLYATFYPLNTCSSDSYLRGIKKIMDLM